MLSSAKIGASSSIMVSVTLSGPVTPRLFVAVPDTATVFLVSVNSVSSTGSSHVHPSLAVWPAGMVRVSRRNSSTASAGDTDTVTVVVALDLLSSDVVTKVRRSLKSPPSKTSARDSDSDTTGVVSSSATASASGSGAMTPRLLVFSTVAETSTVTSPVLSSLSIPVIVTLSSLSVRPAGMVSVLLPLIVTASDGETDTVTMVSALDGLCSVADTVLTPPFSDSQYGESVRPTLGVGETELRRKLATISRLLLRVPTASAGPSTPVEGWSAGTPIGSPL